MARRNPPITATQAAALAAVLRAHGYQCNPPRKNPNWAHEVAARRREAAERRRKELWKPRPHEPLFISRPITTRIVKQNPGLWLNRNPSNGRWYVMYGQRVVSSHGSQRAAERRLAAIS